MHWSKIIMLRIESVDTVRRGSQAVYDLVCMLLSSNATLREPLQPLT